MTPPPTLLRALFALLLAIGGIALPALPARADLKPEEIAVVAVRGNQQSEGLANYYARVRAIPPQNICLIDVTDQEELPRDQWQSRVRPQIRKWFSDRDQQGKIRCLVTIWGVPLKIKPATADPALQRYQQFLTAERTHRLKLLDQILAAFDKIAPGAGDPGVIDQNALSGDDVAASPTKDGDTKKPDDFTGKRGGPSPELARSQQRLEKALQRAQAHVMSLPEGEQRTRGQAQVQQLAAAVGGLQVILPALNQNISNETPNAPAVRAEFDAMRGRLAGLSEARSVMEQMSANIDRDTLILAMLERMGGLIATIQWLDQQLAVVKKNETGASFDSELSLVLWNDDYQLLRWQPNYLRPNFANTQLPTFNRTLMVARIDAPTIELAKKLVDTAMEVEKTGLRGKLYIDTRGIAKGADDANHEPGSFGDYDRSLLTIAGAVDEQTEIGVVVEKTPQLFKPGECPDAALYCGWYSLAKYIDAFDWVPGAVAYHLASAEAYTLHTPNAENWCKRMLEDGVCATIGPVYEPYLAAFPRPDEFFALLLRGDLTLVECYYTTQPFNSWMMTLIGDPLYRPFKYRAQPAPAP